MSNVNLTIAGRSYAVTCADGEEAHLGRLAKLIDEKMIESPGASSQGEARALLFAALMLADELHERRATPSPAPMLGAVATRLENLASHLEALAASA